MKSENEELATICTFLRDFIGTPWTVMLYKIHKWPGRTAVIEYLEGRIEKAAIGCDGPVWLYTLQDEDGNFKGEEKIIAVDPQELMLELSFENEDSLAAFIAHYFAISKLVLCRRVSGSAQLSPREAEAPVKEEKVVPSPERAQHHPHAMNTDTPPPGPFRSQGQWSARPS